MLDEALREARDAVDAASKAARAAAVAVAAITAEQMARHVLDLEDEVERARVALIAFDRVSAGSHQPLPALVFAAIGPNNPALGKPVDTTAWQAAIDQLLADATAEVSVAIPERVATPPPRRYAPDLIYVQPIQRAPVEAEADAAIEAMTEPTIATP